MCMDLYAGGVDSILAQASKQYDSFKVVLFLNYSDSLKTLLINGEGNLVRKLEFQILDFDNPVI